MLRSLKDRMRPEEIVSLSQVADLKEAVDEATLVKMHKAGSMIGTSNDPDAQRLGAMVGQYREMELDLESDHTSASRSG
jgi:hypothetical protein